MESPQSITRLSDLIDVHVFRDELSRSHVIEVKVRPVCSRAQVSDLAFAGSSSPAREQICREALKSALHNIWRIFYSPELLRAYVEASRSAIWPGSPAQSPSIPKELDFESFLKEFFQKHEASPTSLSGVKAKEAEPVTPASWLEFWITEYGTTPVDIIWINRHLTIYREQVTLNDVCATLEKDAIINRLSANSQKAAKQEDAFFWQGALMLKKKCILVRLSRGLGGFIGAKGAAKDPALSLKVLEALSNFVKQTYFQENWYSSGKVNVTFFTHTNKHSAPSHAI